MSRTFSAIHHACLAKPKFRRLSARGRGALLTTWLLAGYCETVAIWRSRGELLEALELDGFTEADLTELESLHWLDPIADGGLAVHDWPDWQRAAVKDGWRAYEAARKREAYQSAKPPSPAPLPPIGDEMKGKGIGPGELRKPPEKDDDDRASEAYEATICRLCHGRATESNPFVEQSMGRPRHRFTPCPPIEATV